MVKLGGEGSGGGEGCGREGKVDVVNPILHYALGLTIEIQEEICDLQRIFIGGVGKLSVEGS